MCMKGVMKKCLSYILIIWGFIQPPNIFILVHVLYHANVQKVSLWKKNKPIAYDFAATIFKKVPHVVKLPVIHHKILKQCKNMLILFPHSFTLHHRLIHTL